MQVMDDQKRIKILAEAAKLFAVQPFHKVLLSDVAEKAEVGKGTLYIYFKNKEELYLSVLYDGFSSLIQRLHDQIDIDAFSPLKNLKAAIREIVRFAYSTPHMFEVMRSVPRWEPDKRVRWDTKRRELKDLL